MRTTLFTSLLLAATVGVGFTNARAQNVVGNYEAPGSLLIYPLYDNTRGALTLITVTNTSPSSSISAHFVYINGANCIETDRSHILTALDTITVNTRVDNPNFSKGYLFVFARQATSPTTEGPNAVKFDHLIGNEFVYDAAGGDLLELNPFTFKAGDQVGAELANTDVSPVNGKRDLNGHEYNFVPDVLEFPRFFGQVAGTAQADLVLLNLTGGAQFTAQANILAYDNNETQFSASVDVQCWRRVPLTTVSALFYNSFLVATSNVIELQQTGVVAGWFTLDGVSASSQATQLDNPAILAVLLDSLVGIVPRVTTLPYGEGTNTNGRLLSHSLMGD